MIEFIDIKSAMHFINNANEELSIRGNKVYKTKTDVWVAEINLKK